jgi:probable HAF family extracellular repeat protein
MKQIIRRPTLAITLFFMLWVILAPGIQAQDQSGTTVSRYRITELPTLGGTVASAESVNDKGWVAGFANLPGDREEHAILWLSGINGEMSITDLGTLPGGPNSAVGFPAKNNHGLLVGFSQTSILDPLREGWNYTCSPGLLTSTSGHLCEGKDLITLGFVWQNGIMTSLPTLGGNISQAFGVNNLDQVVGFAETNTPDSTCVRPQVLDYEAVIWSTDGEIRASLPPFAGDKVSAAVAINDNGDVVGASGPCAHLSPAIGAHALLWRYGSGIPTDLGSLGGVLNNVAFAINGLGQIVGSSGVPDDTTAHAFLWQSGVGMTDLGTLSGDSVSVAFGINDNGQVVGESCAQRGNCRAFLWQNGTMTDLNLFLPPGSTVRLLLANDINDQGQIVGQAADKNTGNFPAFLAMPTSF